jgi:hypothetical protein
LRFGDGRGGALREDAIKVHTPDADTTSDADRWESPLRGHTDPMGGLNPVRSV